MSGRPALDINKLMEARPFSTSHSSLSRRWSLRSLYTCYVSFKEIDSLPRIGESVSSSFPRYVLHQQIHCQGMVDHLWLQMHWNSSRSQSGSSPIMGAGHYDHSKLAGYRSKRSTATGTVTVMVHHRDYHSLAPRPMKHLGSQAIHRKPGRLQSPALNRTYVALEYIHRTDAEVRHSKNKLLRYHNSMVPVAASKWCHHRLECPDPLKLCWGAGECGHIAIWCAKLPVVCPIATLCWA